MFQLMEHEEQLQPTRATSSKETIICKLDKTKIKQNALVPTHYHTRLCRHTLPHEVLSPHITTRSSAPTHYHTRLCPHTLPHEAASPHITTRGSVPTHYHMRLHPHTLPHEASSSHITTRGCVPTHYHTRLCLHTLPHEAASPHITTRGSVPTHNHTRLRPHTLPHEAPSPTLPQAALPFYVIQQLQPRPLLMHPMILFALAAAAWHWLLQLGKAYCACASEDCIANANYGGQVL
ncbi:unnamed protein product [Ranitomeya imitator]|uniref:Uncharacterized protein n=1 Tax=Ranitomeya imitator TaxID=111125 RepID=A0ABN9KML5_9NEOB|nr:unnamed protein product [Ranitomeya imitator]